MLVLAAIVQIGHRPSLLLDHLDDLPSAIQIQEAVGNVGVGPCSQRFHWYKLAVQIEKDALGIQATRV